MTSPALTSLGPSTSMRMVFSSCVCIRRRTSLRLRMMSVTSSATLEMLVNSCSTPSMRTLVMAAPWSELRSTRRSALPRVMPNPRSSGSATNLPYVSVRVSCSTCRPRGLIRSRQFFAISASATFLLLAAPPASTAELRGTIGSSAAGTAVLPCALLRVELDDQLLLDGHGDVVAARGGLHRPLDAALVEIEPGRNSAAVHRLQCLVDADDLAGLLLHRDDVADLHLEAGNVDLAVVDAEVPVPHELARLRARVGKAEAEDHVVEALLEELEQVLAGLALGGAAAQVVAAELRLEQAVEPLHLLLLAELHAVLGELGAALAVLARRVRAALDGALVRVAAVALEVHLQIFAPADAAGASCISSHLRILYTRRRLGGRQPLCGMGVMSRMSETLRPAAAMARSADSRPAPGPFTITETFLRPCSIALAAASPAATCAAKGVDLREPLNPRAPAEDQESTFPLTSVMVMMVLLKVLWMKTIPVWMFFLLFFLPFLPLGSVVAAAPAAGAPGAAGDGVWGGFCSSAIGHRPRRRFRAWPARRRGGRGRCRASDPCGCGRWYGCAGRGRVALCGGAGRGSSRGPSGA